MNLKRVLLELLTAEQLKELCNEVEVEADRRSAAAMTEALAGAKRAKPERLVEPLTVPQLREALQRFERPTDGKRGELVRRLLENTANESFLRASFVHQLSEEQLLMNPVNKRAVGSGQWTDNGKEEHTAPSKGHQPEPLSLAAFRNEPLADFSRADAREAMQTALTFVKGEMSKNYSVPAIVGGSVVPASG